MRIFNKEGNMNKEKKPNKQREKIIWHIKINCIQPLRTIERNQTNSGLSHGGRHHRLHILQFRIRRNITAGLQNETPVSYFSN